MRKSICVAAVMAGLATAAEAQQRLAVWERGDVFICRAEVTRVCNGREATCRVTTGTAVFTLNFRENRFRVFGSDERFAETIAMIRCLLPLVLLLVSLIPGRAETAEWANLSGAFVYDGAVPPPRAIRRNFPSMILINSGKS